MDWHSLLRAARGAYVNHLEDEVAYLRGRCALLEVKLETALTPKTPEPSAPRPVPVMPRPTRTTWEQFVADDMKRQEAEELDGTSSN